MAKTGILGGTFNPPHLGHLHAARAAAKALSLDRVFLIPTNIPPHKEGPAGATPSQRLEMTRLAAGENQLFSVLDCELRREGKSYSVDTVNELSATYPEDEFWFIVGTDMFLTLHQWHKADELLRKTGIAVVPRDKSGLAPLFAQKQKLEEKFGAKIYVVDVPPLEISSTDIRFGQKQAYISPEVAEYIQNKGLYKQNES
jgi:nicotinate-nucleotide adenylyltransferase